MVKSVELKRGHGSIIRLKQRDAKTAEQRDSKFWYVFYYVGTRQVRENTKTADYSEAYNMLIERRADAAEGKPAVSDIRRYRYEDIRDSYISTLKLKKRVSLYSHTDENGQPNVTFRGLDHFNKSFKNMVATKIDSDKTRKYAEWRSREGQADPTIRRQLVALRPMFRLAAREKKTFSGPYFAMPEGRRRTIHRTITISRTADAFAQQASSFFQLLVSHGLPHRRRQRDQLAHGELGRQRDRDPGRVDESTETSNGRVGRNGSRTSSQRIEKDVSAPW
jgi:hypothetical protein